MRLDLEEEPAGVVPLPQRELLAGLTDLEKCTVIFIIVAGNVQCSDDGNET